MGEVEVERKERRTTKRKFKEKKRSSIGFQFIWTCETTLIIPFSACGINSKTRSISPNLKISEG